MLHLHLLAMRYGGQSKDAKRHEGDAEWYWILNNRHGLAYIKRPDRSIIELNTSSPKPIYSWAKHMPSMWTALVNVIRNVLRHAGSRLPCWVYHVLDFVLVFVCFCFCVARAICAMCLTLFLCVLRSMFVLVRLYSLVATYLSPNLHWFWLIFIPNEMC